MEFSGRYRYRSVLAILCCLISSGICSVSASDLNSAAGRRGGTGDSPALDAFGSLAIGYNWLDANQGGEAENGKGLMFAGRGSFFAPLSGFYGFQLDGVYERSSYGSGLPTENAGALAAHVFTRNAAGLLGVIGQVNMMSTSGTNSAEHDFRYFIGAEGQYFVNSAVTLYGQAAYQNYNRGSSELMFASPASAGIFDLVGQVRYFVAEDVMLMAKLAYETGTMNNYFSSISANSWAATGKIMYHIHHTPVSVFGELQYRRSDFRVSDSAIGQPASERETRALLGLKYSFTGKSLIERDRTGASLDPIEPLATAWPVPRRPVAVAD